MIIKLITEVDQALRSSRQRAVDAGELPDFRADSMALREGEWCVTSPGGCQSGPRYYLAGVRSVSEAEVWRDSLEPDGPICSAGVILWLDTIWGALEVEEILYALKDVVCDVACDLDGYLLSFIETFQAYPEFVLPDRADITSGTHLLDSFTRLVGAVCRRRGVGAAAMAGAEPVQRGRIEAADLLLVPRGRITERGIRRNIRIALACLEEGEEDPVADDETQLRRGSAARLAAAQLWQWVRHETGVLDEGRIVTGQLVERLLEEEASRAQPDKADAGAAAALAGTVLGESFSMHAFR